MKPVITEPPEIEPITYAQAKQQCKIDDDHSRDWINRTIRSVRATAETETGLSLITRTIAATWQLHEISDLNHYGYGIARYVHSLPLPNGPVQAVTGITDGDNHAVSPTNYVLHRIGTVDYVHFTKSVKFPVTVTYTAGYGDTADDVPADIQDIMLGHLAWLWSHRTAEGTPDLEHIYRRHRSSGFAA